MLGDILENFSDQEILDTALYKTLIEFLKEVKLIHGPVGLDKTLKRHKKIYLFLHDYQKRYIIDLESKISGNNHCIRSE